MEGGPASRDAAVTHRRSPGSDRQDPHLALSPPAPAQLVMVRNASRWTGLEIWKCAGKCRRSGTVVFRNPSRSDSAADRRARIGPRCPRHVPCYLQSVRYGRRQDQRLSATRCNERGTHLGHHTGSHRGRATTMLRLRQMSQSTSVVIPCSITNSKPVRTTANSALCMPLSVLYVAANYKIKAQTATRSQLSLLARDECETSLIH